MKWFKKKDEVVLEEKKESEIDLHENITATEYYSTVYDLTKQTQKQFQNLMKMDSDSTQSLDQLLNVNQETIESIRESSETSKKLAKKNDKLEEKISAVAGEMKVTKSSPNLCVKYFFPGTSCAGDANASMSVHYHS